MSNSEKEEDPPVPHRSPSPSISPEISNPPSAGEEEQEDDIVGAALKRTRNRSAAPRRDEIILGDEQEEQIVDDMIKLMETAAEEDKIALTNKHGLAIAKLTALDRVEKFLSCGKYHETFLIMNGCNSLNKWVQRHENGAFPSDPVLVAIMRAIKELPVSIENL
jgi:hypothetical protein